MNFPEKPAAAPASPALSESPELLRQAAPLDVSFFLRLIEMSPEMFEAAVLHQALRGNISAINEAIAAMEAPQSLKKDAGVMELLWHAPAEASLMSKSKEGLFVQAILQQSSLHQLVALALCIPPTAEGESLARGTVASAETAYRNGWKGCADRQLPVWTAQKQRVLERFIDLCREQCRLIPSHHGSPAHPVSLLLSAVVERMPLDEPVRLIFDRVEPEFLKSDKNFTDTLSRLVGQDRLSLACSLMENAVGGDKRPARQLASMMLVNMNRNELTFRGILDGAVLARKAWGLEGVEGAAGPGASARGTRQSDDDTLLEQEEECARFMRVLCRSVPHKAADLTARVMAALFDRCDKLDAPWSRALTRALMTQLDLHLGVASHEPWPLSAKSPDSPESVGAAEARMPTVTPAYGVTPMFVRALLEAALRHRAGALVEKLSPALREEPDSHLATKAWHKSLHLQPHNMDDFRQTLKALQGCGIDLSCPHEMLELIPPKNASFNVALSKRASECETKLTTATALSEIAGSGLDNALVFMSALLDMGADPHVKDTRNYTAASCLPAHDRERWMDLVRSREAKRQALSSLAELFGGEIIDSDISGTAKTSDTSNISNAGEAFETVAASGSEGTSLTQKPSDAKSPADTKDDSQTSGFSASMVSHSKGARP